MPARDVKRLTGFFEQVDVDHSGSISVPEFTALIGAADTAFVRVLIDLMVFELLAARKSKFRSGLVLFRRRFLDARRGEAEKSRVVR